MPPAGRIPFPGVKALLGALALLVLLGNVAMAADISFDPTFCNACHNPDPPPPPEPEPEQSCTSCHTSSPVNIVHYEVPLATDHLAFTDSCASADCHTLPTTHPDIVTAQPRPVCTSCHKTNNLEYPDIAYTFPIDEVHVSPEGLTCSECHPAVPTGDIFLRPVAFTCTECHAPSEGALSIEKFVQGAWVIPGGTLTYRFEVSNSGMIPLSQVTVIDDGCADHSQMSGGDANDNGLLDPDEVWIFTCVTTPAWDPDHVLSSTARVSGGYLGLPLTATGFASLTPVSIGTEVLDYSGDEIAWAKPLTVRMSRYDPGTGTYSFLSSFSVIEGTPLRLLLTEGQYRFEETGLPQGFVQVNPVDIAVPFQSYPASVSFNNRVWFGCSPGYWKSHVSSWPAGYSTGILVSTRFNNAAPYQGKNLLQALGLKGGTGTNGAKETLLRAATAGLLNEAWWPADNPAYNGVDALQSAVSEDLGKDRATMLKTATRIDGWNNGYCPLP